MQVDGEFRGLYGGVTERREMASTRTPKYSREARFDFPSHHASRPMPVQFLSAVLLAEKSYTVGVGLTLLCVILGMIVAVGPTKRSAEIKKSKVD
jgi:hypothetical protein